MITPSDVEGTYRVKDGLYLLGSLEKGVTVYSQQVRAHNLVWALWELERKGQRRLGRVAVVGGGVSGLTVVAGLLGLFKGAAPIFLFQRLWDFCSFQQGADTRWVHPQIYNWPAKGSRAPSASLPLLNWSGGRASDMTRTILGAFGDYCEAFSTQRQSLSVVVGLKNIQIRADSLEIEWEGTRAERGGPFFRRTTYVNDRKKFDTVILTTGFGLERQVSPYKTPSYWRNEQFGQPALDGQPARYVISGYGDGALVDLCRLTIERFRQDTVVYELFGSEPEKIEQQMEADLTSAGKNLFRYFSSLDRSSLKEPLEKLARRLRKDTSVELHISGKNQSIKSIEEIFGPTSSVLNRLLTYLLYRCEAFSVGFSDLATCVRHHKANSDGVVCRHGTDAIECLKDLITDHAEVDARLHDIRTKRAQSAARLWALGSFPTATRGQQV